MLKILFRILFICIVLVSFKKYINYSNNVNLPIKYTYIDTTIDNWRGTSYLIRVLYNGRNYETYITESMYEGIRNAKYPMLYYATGEDDVFSEWEIRRHFRIAVVFSIFLVLTFIPIKKET